MNNYINIIGNSLNFAFEKYNYIFLCFGIPLASFFLVKFGIYWYFKLVGKLL